MTSYQQISISTFSVFGVSEHQEWWYWYVSSPAITSSQTKVYFTICSPFIEIVESWQDIGQDEMGRATEKNRRWILTDMQKGATWTPEGRKPSNDADPNQDNGQAVSCKTCTCILRNVRMSSREEEFVYRRTCNREFLRPTRVRINSV